MRPQSAPRAGLRPPAPRGGTRKVAKPHFLVSAPRAGLRPPAPRGGTRKVAKPHFLVRRALRQSRFQLASAWAPSVPAPDGISSATVRTARCQRACTAAPRLRVSLRACPGRQSGCGECIATAIRPSTKTSILPSVRGSEAFWTTAESVLHDGQCLTRFIEAAVQPPVEHGSIQAAFEARTKESLAQCKRSRMASSSGEVFDKL